MWTEPADSHLMNRNERIHLLKNTEFSVLETATCPLFLHTVFFLTTPGIKLLPTPRNILEGNIQN